MFIPHRVIYSPHSRTRTKISEERYEIIKNFIINILLLEKEITFSNLLTRAEEQSDKLLGNVTAWYVLKIKQDLEVRKIIKVKHSVVDRAQIITINPSQISAHL